jgi:hypothetical protein
MAAALTFMLEMILKSYRDVVTFKAQGVTPLELFSFR